MSDDRSAIEKLVETLPTGAVRRECDDLSFESAWEIRAFAIAIAGSKAGQYEWSEFRNALVNSIAGWESSGQDEESFRYYEHWVDALETVLSARSELDTRELDVRAHKVLTADPAHQPPQPKPVRVQAAGD